MEVSFSDKDESRYWLLYDDGSAMPLSSYLAEQDMSYDDINEWHDKAHPEYKDENYEAVYKQGGPRRTE